MKTTIYLSRELKKDIKVQAVINEIKTSTHVNTIIKIYKEDILKMVNEYNDKVRDIVLNRETFATYEIEDEIRKFCEKNKLQIRVVIIIAAYLYQKKHNK